MNEGETFDLSAASWRRGLTDEKAYVEALATRLAQALPGSTRVEREHHLLSGEQSVRSIEVEFERNTYRLRFEKHKGVSAERAKIVRGIALKTEPLGFAEWLSGLSSELAGLATQHEDSRKAIEQFLFS